MLPTWTPKATIPYSLKTNPTSAAAVPLSHIKGFTYNTGATTLAGYEDGQVVKEMFDAIGFVPDVIATDPAIVIIQGEKIVPRHRDLDLFLEAP